MKKPHVVILGGTRGLGRVLARLFAAQGMRVSVIGGRAPEKSDRRWRDVSFFQADLTDEKATEKVLAAIVKGGGKANYVVFAQRYRGEKRRSWDGELALMLSVPRRVLSWMEGRFAATGDRGVVLIGSPAGRFVLPEQDDAYHTTRAALTGLMRWWAARLGPRGVRVNLVTPGAFVRESPELRGLQPPAAGAYARFVPLGRMGTAAEVASFIALMCSPAAGFVTGQEIMVDGGASVLGQEPLGVAAHHRNNRK